MTTKLQLDAGRAIATSGIRVAKLFAYRRTAAMAFAIGVGLPSPSILAAPPELLFWSGYEAATTIELPGAPPAPPCFGGPDNGCWQRISGTDATTSFRWPPVIWGSDPEIGAGFQLLADASEPVTPDNIGNYMVNQIQLGAGQNGTQALYSEIKQSGCCGMNPQGSGATQDPYTIFPIVSSSNPETGLYISYWIKFQSNLQEIMTDERLDPRPEFRQTWRTFFAFKTNGDFRLAAYVATWRDGCGGNPTGQLFWRLQADNVANGGLPPQVFWMADECSVPVPVDQWVKVEFFWHRSGNFLDNSGRAWMAVDGQVIANVSNVNMTPNVICAMPCNTSMMGINNAPINRIFANTLYTGSPYPVFQWVDDVQIWRGFPTAGLSDPWYDPPYAPH
jgi:hypothetical protein